MIGRPEHYNGLIRKLVQANGDLGQVTLEPAEEILLRRVLDGGDSGIIGRESFSIEALAKLLNVGANSRHAVTKLREVHRGYWFEVQIYDDKGEPTGHVANVTVRLDRLEAP